MTRLLGTILASAAQQMWKDEPTLSRYTFATMEHELNVAFHYACQLRRWLPWFDCDFDIQKPGMGLRRPDIIFHLRGIHEGNFLVIEVKRKGDIGEARADLAKTREYWFGEHFKYEFGASVCFDEKAQTTKLCVIQNGTEKIADEYMDDRRFPLIGPTTNVDSIHKCRSVAQQLVAASKIQDKEAVQRLRSELHQQIIKLYL